MWCTVLKSGVSKLFLSMKWNKMKWIKMFELDRKVHPSAV